MKKILIADDEARARRFLQTTLQAHAEELNIRIVGEACDGIEAQELFCEYLPDIVLMDIDMPFQDGLTTLRHMRSIKQNTKIIIITGHNRFDYAHNALNSGADYLMLKPVVVEELIHTVQKLSAELDEALLRIAKWDHMNSVVTENLSLLRRNFIKTIISSEHIDLQTILRTAEMYGIHLIAEQYFVACVQLQSLQPQQLGDNSLMLLGLENIIKSMAAERGVRSYSYVTAQNRIVVLFCCGNMEIVEKECLMTELRDAAETFTNDHVRWGAGCLVTDLLHVKNSFFGAQQALHFQHQEEGSHTSDYNGLASVSKAASYYLGSDIENILSLFRVERISDVEERIRDIFKRIHADNAVEHSRNFSMELIFALRRSFTELDLDMSDLAEAETEIIRGGVSVDRCQSLLIALVKRLSEEKNKAVGQRLSKKIKIAQDYIRENYADPNLGLQAVSSYVNLSTTYFCSLFFTQVGVRFNEYLTTVRIEKAKELLSSGVAKVYEVASEAGFYDPKYFSSKFKKMVGMSPSEFRESCEISK